MSHFHVYPVPVGYLWALIKGALAGLLIVAAVVVILHLLLR
jgi:hypothetical protein